ncbi:MAG: COX15/CtaA family protein [Geminicoccaceae bacterium]
MRALRWTTGGALVLTYGLIVLGAWVRATGSGLSCPDWPTCYGHWLPLPGDIPADVGYSYAQVMLEWAHRLIAGVILGPSILVIGLLAWQARRERPRMPAYAGALIVLLLFQAGLGGLTVLDQNSPWSVALHLGTALVLLSVLCLIFERTGRAPHPVAAAARALSGVVWLIALGAMVSAAMVAKTGAALACSTTWPLCDGALVPDLGDAQIRLHFTHRLLALGTGLGVLALAVAARGQPELRPLAWLALALVAVEIGLGAVVVLGEVPFGTALAHQALGVLIFAILSAIMWRAHGRASDREIAHGLSHA